MQLLSRAALAMLMLNLFLCTGRATAQPKHDDKPKPEMKVPPANTGFLGAKFNVVDDDDADKLGVSAGGGMIVIEIMEDSPAETSGLKEEDVILKIDGEDIADRDGFIAFMSETKPGQTITISVMREKQPQDIVVTLGQRPKNFPSSQPTTKP